MKIILVILLGTVLGVFSLADGYQRTDNYSPYYGFNHPNDPFYSKGHLKKTDWKKPVSSKWNSNMKELEWKKPMQQKYNSFGQWSSKWFKNSPQTQVPKWRKNSFNTRQYSLPPVSNRPQPQGAIPYVPLKPRKNLNLDSIQWPAYIPPVTMIKPRLDEPPAA